MGHFVLVHDTLLGRRDGPMAWTLLLSYLGTARRRG